MKILVVTGEHASVVPPQGYCGITRLAWAAAREFAILGHQVSFAAPRLRQESSCFRAFVATYHPPVDPAVVAMQDAVYMTDIHAFELLKPAIVSNPHVLFVLEENAPWIAGLTAPNLKRIVYRSDRLIQGDRGTAWFCDQVLMRDEVGAPTPDGGYVLWLGRLHLDKNPDAIVTFAEAASPFHIVVAGPAQDDEPIWPRNVRRVPEVGGQEKQTLLCSASALLYTVSPFWRGAGESVLTEAAACGVPILAQTFSYGCPAHRCVVDGANGFLHHDPGVLARLLPLALAMDREQLYRRAWRQLGPKAAATQRIALMSAALHQLRPEGPR